MKRLLLPLAVAAGCFVASAAAQSGHSGWFLTTLGTDTIAVEQYTFDQHGLEGTSVVRSPRTSIRSFKATFGPKGQLMEFRMESGPVDAKPTASRDYVYSGDSVRVTSIQDTTTRKFTVAAPGHPLPFFIDLISPWDVALRHALAPGGERAFSLVAGRELIRYALEGNSPGTVDLTSPEADYGPLHATLGPNNQLEKLDLTATTDKFIATRIGRVDVPAMARAFAAREKAGNALGTLSPRDTVRATVNGAHILIDYGRPATRGRVIFGNVVPWDKVWRTGANAATQLMTDKPLSFGTAVLPAGTYTLFTLPSQQGWTLIINSQHGQWGTDYDKSKDFARLPLSVEHLNIPVDRFTFEIPAAETGGSIRLMWDKTQAAVPFAVQ